MVIDVHAFEYLYGITFPFFFPSHEEGLALVV